MIENNHKGIIVLFLYPTPKSRKEPSLLYKNVGLNIWTMPKIIKNIIIDVKVVLFLVNVRNIFIYIIVTFL